MSGAPDLSRRSKKGFLKGNRSLVILLVDILLICLLAVGYRFLLYKPSHSASLAGYSLTLKGLPIGDKVVVSLSVERKKRDAPSGRLFVIFRLEDEELRLSEELPSSEGQIIEITGSLFVRAYGEELIAEAEIEGERKILSRKLEKS
jgi:hypothetical protein